MIRGIPVTLYERTETTSESPDPFGIPVYTETPVTVANVLVAPSTQDEVLSSVNLTGKRAVYTLHIPKGDAHAWEGCEVVFFAQRWRVIGPVVEYIGANVPGPWNRKVMVETVVGADPPADEGTSDGTTAPGTSAPAEEAQNGGSQV